MMLNVLLNVLEFFCGSMMFSFWLGLAAKKNLSEVGDGNPGAFNLIHSAGLKIGLLGVALDFFKGYFPLVLFLSLGYGKGLALIPVALAPIIGHAFSPFLHFKGGKCIAVTFGVWSAVTGFSVSILYALILAVLMVIARLFTRGKSTTAEMDAFMTVTGLAVVFIFLYISGSSFEILSLCLLNLTLLTYTNRRYLYLFYRLHVVRLKPKEECEALKH